MYVILNLRRPDEKVNIVRNTATPLSQFLPTTSAHAVSEIILQPGARLAFTHFVLVHFLCISPTHRARVQRLAEQVFSRAYARTFCPPSENSINARVFSRIVILYLPFWQVPTNVLFILHNAHTTTNLNKIKKALKVHWLKHDVHFSRIYLRYLENGQIGLFTMCCKHKL